MKPDPRDEIAITWHVDDVASVAPDLTLQQRREVLALVSSEHDASIGVSWETLEYWADHVRNEAEWDEIDRSKA